MTLNQLHDRFAAIYNDLQSEELIYKDFEASEKNRFESAERLMDEWIRPIREEIAAMDIEMAGQSDE